MLPILVERCGLPTLIGRPILYTPADKWGSGEVRLQRQVVREAFNQSGYLRNEICNIKTIAAEGKDNRNGESGVDGAKWMC